jgi:hypothetical protein
VEVEVNGLMLVEVVVVLDLEQTLQLTLNQDREHLEMVQQELQFQLQLIQ